MLLISLGCFKEFTTILNNLGAPSLTMNSSSAITCHGFNNGSATVIATGGAGGETYSWDNGETAPTANSLGPGLHTLNVTDSIGCKAFLIVDINEPQEIYISTVITTQLKCPEDSLGNALVHAIGGTGNLSYSWSSGQTTPEALGLETGKHRIYVTDMNGCEKIDSVTFVRPDSFKVNFQVNENLSPVPNYTGSISTLVSGGTPPYSVDWTGPVFPEDSLPFSSQGTLFLFNLWCGNYVLTITDANNCVYVDSVEVTSSNAACAVSIEEELNVGISKMEIIPNPNNGSFWLNLQLAEHNSLRLDLIDQRGKVIISENAGNVLFYEKQFSLNHLSSGIYFLTARTSQGFVSRKFVISKQ